MGKVFSVNGTQKVSQTDIDLKWISKRAHLEYKTLTKILSVLQFMFHSLAVSLSHPHTAQANIGIVWRLD